MARFDYSSKCAHPRICQRLMQDFLQDACTLTWENELVEILGKDEKGWPIFGDHIFEEVFCKISVKKGPCFRTYICENKQETLEIFYNYTTLNTKCLGHVEFNKNIHLRAFHTKGFSWLTLSLLHELGHQETEEKVPCYYNRAKAIEKIHKMYKKSCREAHQAYFALPDEYLATQWAIDWLAVPENRKKAKAFEKAFFKAWRG